MLFWGTGSEKNATQEDDGEKVDPAAIEALKAWTTTAAVAVERTLPWPLPDAIPKRRSCMR